MRCLIAYDICEPRRLQRVQRHLQQYARPLQRSVYLFEGNEADFSRCLTGLEQRIDAHHDDIRIYGIARMSQLQSIGAGLNPEGIWLSS